MATVTLSRSDLFPVGTVVGIYPAHAARRRNDPPGAAAIATGTVDAAGALSVTNGGIVAGTDYAAYALVSTEHRYVRVRSTLDKFDRGDATGTGDTSSGSLTVLNASAAAGTFRTGQIVTGPGIPAQTRIIGVSGSTLTLSTKATATATGVALIAYGALTWSAKLAQRREAIGTV